VSGADPLVLPELFLISSENAKILNK